MLKDGTYDLMETASVLSKGLHRYDTFTKDARGCAECQAVWKYMKETDEQQLARLLQHLRQHFDVEMNVQLAGV
jgi:hypothetical protein